MRRVSGARGAELGRSVHEHTVVRGKLVERDIVSTDETQFLQIGVGEPPTAALVHPCAVRQHAGQRALSLHLADALDLGVEHPLLPPIAVRGRESQSRLQTASEFVFG